MPELAKSEEVKIACFKAIKELGVSDFGFLVDYIWKHHIKVSKLLIRCVLMDMLLRKELLNTEDMLVVLPKEYYKPNG